MGHSRGGDTNLADSLGFHNLKQGDLLGTLADFLVSKTSIPSKTHQFTITIWGLWEILPIYWKSIFMEEAKKATYGLLIYHPYTPKSVPLLKKMDWFSTRRKNLL